MAHTLLPTKHTGAALVSSAQPFFSMQSTTGKKTASSGYISCTQLSQALPAHSLPPCWQPMDNGGLSSTARDTLEAGAAFACTRTKVCCRALTKLFKCLTAFAVFLSSVVFWLVRCTVSHEVSDVLLALLVLLVLPSCGARGFRNSFMLN